MKTFKRLFYHYKYWLLKGEKIPRDLIIVRFDGGICSQIAFWALAHDFEQRGFHVKYDLSWYETNGKDSLGHFNRNFDLTHSFPNLKYEVATKNEVRLYKRIYNMSKSKLDNIQAPPAYLGAYYDRFPLVARYRDTLNELFNPDNGKLDKYNSKIHQLISQPHPACAVHVRRGDLAVFNEAYGHPPSLDYFLNAISEVLKAHPQTRFFLFSDEPDWVETKLIPALKKDIKTCLVSVNHSDKGYRDLYLMSKCSTFIASQGSLAKFARIMSKKKDALIVEPASKQTFKDIASDNVIVLEDYGGSCPDGGECKKTSAD